MVAIAATGCSNVLGADFQPDEPEPSFTVSIELSEHPHEALHSEAILRLVPHRKRHGAICFCLSTSRT